MGRRVQLGAAWRGIPKLSLCLDAISDAWVPQEAREEKTPSTATTTIDEEDESTIDVEKVRLADADLDPPSSPASRPIPC